MNGSDNRTGGLIRRLMVVALAATMGLFALPATAAQAATWRSATATGWGPSPASGQQSAANNARAALTSLAASLGETCSNVTVPAPRHLYTAPDGSAYIYEATATGYCVPAPPPSYTVARSATRQGSGASSTIAIQNGSQAARADILAVGVACANWATNSSKVFTAPDGSWHVYNVTVSALCAN
ncbi:hypothetical protein O7632_21625 [Solwaraspora sp. WMMD406]|uniref:hypothetical protein n=1 Tax=Solwaraspora sp. WMMD406 TaxID=3016095 RepID=UPI002416D887|nr:hypothetical protein [Solwaraspora sp. WMMD406]MDG4766676.1 hypothetical protein [Solwaraspora sp. WMMD406]